MRSYNTPIGRLPSVTTILGATADKTWLQKWIAQVGEAEAERIRKEAAARGTRLHEEIETYYNDFEPGRGPYWESIAYVLPRITKPILLEAFVWHTSGYAGTCDFLGYFDGELAVVDWKTSEKSKRDEWVFDYKLQACAYARAIRERYEEHKNLARTAVVIALPDEPAQVFVSNREELGAQWRAWCKRFEEYKSKR